MFVHGVQRINQRSTVLITHLVYEQFIGDSLNGCAIFPLFELVQLQHDQYLLNIRLAVDSENITNLDINDVRNLRLQVIYKSGGSAELWLGLKTAFFLCIIGVMGWFWRRVNYLKRSPVPIEYMLMYLASALTLLNGK